MTDRELLKLAAKAIGHGLEWVSVKLDDVPEPRLTDSNPYWFNWPRWNPLDDDGDALRLAMKLRLYVYVGSMRTAVSSWSLGMEPEDAVKEDFSDSTDEAVAAATRRAIVRAAAAITQSR